MSQSAPSGIQWRKSSHSSNSGGQCVEIAALPGRVGVRDSKNPGGSPLIFTRPAFRMFARRLRAGR